VRPNRWVVEVLGLGRREWRRIDDASTLGFAREVMLGAGSLVELRQGDLVRVSDGFETRRLAVMSLDRGVLEVHHIAHLGVTWTALWQSTTQVLELAAVGASVDARRVALAAARIADLALPIVEGDAGLVRNSVEMVRAWALGESARWGRVSEADLVLLGKDLSRFADRAAEIDDGVALAVRSAEGATHALKGQLSSRRAGWAYLRRLLPVAADAAEAIYANSQSTSVFVEDAVDAANRAYAEMSRIIIHEIPLAAVLLGLHNEKLPFDRPAARNNPSAEGFSVAPLTAAEAAELRTALARRRKRPTAQQARRRSATLRGKG
jgi:hypothetical protein